jgi:hypothetical protein
MKINIGMIIFAALFTGFMFSSNVSADVQPWFVEEMHNDEAILFPGTTTYCNKDFKVENMGTDLAEVHVILGNGANYATDQLEPGAVKSYSLSADYPQSGGWEGMKGIHIDDARIVNGTAGMSDIKVHCK